MQISTSVQQTTEVVALKPAVITLRAATRVAVYQDTPEMDLSVLVDKMYSYVLLQATSAFTVDNKSAITYE